MQRYGEAFVCKFYGILPDGAAVTASPMMTEETVAEYKFEYGTTTKLSVFVNGKQYSLEKAYEDGVLTKEQIGEIWEAYTK